MPKRVASLETVEPVTGGLAREIGKREPFESPAHEAYLNLIRTADLLSKEHAALFAEHGLSSPLYNILRILSGHESDGEAGRHGVPATQVAREMITREPDITRLADRLQKLGLVERHRCDSDRRVVRLRLTAQGRKKVRALDRPALDLVESQFCHLAAAEVEALNRLLFKVTARPG